MVDRLRDVGDARRARESGPARRHGTAVAVLAVVLAAGCDELLNVSSPGEVDAGTLDNPTMAATLVVGAVADFECAFAFYSLLGGTVGNEWMNSGTLAVYNNYDRRRVGPDEGSLNTGLCESTVGLYVPLSKARFMADDAYVRVESFSDAEIPNRSGLLATAAAYGGYSLVLFGEGFCETALDAGPVLTPRQVLGLAEERFTRAILHAQSANNAELLSTAYVGRARARLGLGDLDGAASDARNVPEGFRKDATYSGVNARRWNKLHTFPARSRLASIHPDFWDVTWEGEPDPRVQVTVTTVRGTDGFTPIAVPDRYPNDGSPIPLATWEEAQLIIAEAEGGQTAVDIINDLLERVGLAPTFEASDPEAIRAGIIEQRRRQLFLQSHHLGDMLRYGLPFSSGFHPFTQIDYFDVTTCFPLPDVERLNNPNIG